MNLLKLILEFLKNLFIKDPSRIEGPKPEKVVEDFKKAFPTKEEAAENISTSEEIMDKIFYNEASAEKLGWKPSWFGAEENDEELIEAVKVFQGEHGLQSDGLVGPTTFRRIWTSRESRIDSYGPSEAKNDNKINHLVHNGSFYEIKWDKVKLWSEEGGLSCYPTGGRKQYYDYAGKPEREPKFFVNHWDVCLNSASCARVLQQRGISIHFCIDNDGTIYQLLDTQHAAWHAGGNKWNHNCLGVEISNAYYPKYQPWYERNGFGERPIISEQEIHGQILPDFTDFYPVQIEALKALWEAIHNKFDIPYACPVDSAGETLWAVSDQAAANEFEGFISHYHLYPQKIDCAGLDIKKLMKEIKK